MIDTVLVTGGTGYIAGELVRQLVEKGWSVHATIRDLAKENRLREALQVDNSRLHVFATDLTSDSGWAEAVAGCSHVAHLASPFPVGLPRNEDDLILPARDGALRALRFANEAGVRRFVMTSSAAAIAYGHERSRTVFDESDWTNLEAPNVQPYIKSKTIAERAARDWVAENAGDMVYCSINPVAILGPVQTGDYAASIELVKRLLDGSIPALPNVGFGIVDVRDVADLHVRALTASAGTVQGERFIASGAFYKMAEVAQVLRERLDGDAKKVPKRKLPDFAVRLFALFDPSVRQLLGELGKTRAMDSSHAKQVLGWQARPADDTIADTARSLMALGIV